MMYEKEFLLNEINKIRDEIGHDNVNIFIEKIYFNENTKPLLEKEVGLLENSEKN